MTAKGIYPTLTPREQPPGSGNDPRGSSCREPRAAVALSSRRSQLLAADAGLHRASPRFPGILRHRKNGAIRKTSSAGDKLCAPESYARALSNRKMKKRSHFPQPPPDTRRNGAIPEIAPLPASRTSWIASFLAAGWCPGFAENAGATARERTATR
jgi:hypothetical protein